MTLATVAEQIHPAVNRHDVGEGLIRMTQNIVRLEVALRVEDWREVVAVHEVEARTLVDGDVLKFRTKTSQSVLTSNTI